MKQVFLRKGREEAVIEEIPPPAIRAGGVLVRSAFSLISAGTERASLSSVGHGVIHRAAEHPDIVRKVFESLYSAGVRETYRKVMDKLSELTPVGYSASGVVLEAGEGADEFSKGDKVACAGAVYANHAQIICVPKNLCTKIPDGVSLEHAACTTLGAIALQGVRQSNAVIGENVAVIGLGLVGLITVQILRAGGIRTLGLDIDDERVKLAVELGAQAGAVIGHDDVPVVSRSFSRGHGVDAVIITAATPSDEPIELAGRMCRNKGKVVVVGDVGLKVPRNIYYEKELSLLLSRSYGPGRYDPQYEEKGIDYPIGYVRWTERRNMEEFLHLMYEGKIDLDRLITHRFRLEEAPHAYGLLSGQRREKYLGILLTYDMGEQAASKVRLRPSRESAAKEKLSVGFIGAGSFSQGVLLPILKGIPGIYLKGVSNATGASAKKAGEKFGFEHCTTRNEDILDDEGTDIVFIGTRHNLHAPLAVEALKKGKSVFMEKPMAMNRDELEGLMKVWRETGGRLMVGFNRRFSSFAQRMKDFFRPTHGGCPREEPLQMIYRVNAGFLPPSHWVHDPREGGGRIVGEVCHFVDFFTFLAGSVPVRVFSEAITQSGDALSRDNISTTIRFSEGSWGTIAYIARGHPSVPKEKVEVHCGGSSAFLEDFRSLTLFKDGREEKIVKAQDKGHDGEMHAFIDALRNSKAMPMDAEESARITLTTFLIEESLTKGLPVDIQSIHKPREKA